MNTLPSSSGASSSESKKSSEENKTQNLDCNAPNNIDMNVDDKNDSLSSCDDLSPEQMKLILKETKKRKNADFKELFALAKGKINAAVITVRHDTGDESSDVERAADSHPIPCSSTGTIPNSKHSSPYFAEILKPSCCGSVDKQHLNARKVLCKRRRVQYEKKAFQGEFFRYKATDPEVTEIYPGLFVSNLDLKHAKIVARDSKSALTRSLLKLVYSKESLEQCSLTGRPASGQGRENAVTRPALHPLGVTGIIKYVCGRCSKKGWPKPNITNLRRAISSVLCEDRYYEKLQEGLSVETSAN